MKRLLFLLATVAPPALASPDPVADTRAIMAGSVSTTTAKSAYTSGARDGWTSFKGALAAYKAVRAAEVPVVVPPPVVPPHVTPVEPPPVVVVTPPHDPAPPPVTPPAPVGVADVPSNFDTSALLAPTTIPSSAAPDVVGAFRFGCSPGQLLRDDPVVYPGQPGKSHLHQFYGNLTVNADSTYEAMRKAGGSSCEGFGTTALNRSGYWMPAMLDGIGNVVRPDFISIYYKRRPISDPYCSLTSGEPKAEGNCVPLPNGLRFVFGYDMLTGKAPTGSLYFTCQGPTSTATASYPTITEAAKRCPTAPTITASGGKEYNKLGAIIQAPSCWDGKNLDSPNHRDHVAYGGYGWWGYYKCPTTHPYVIPGFQLGAWFTVDENLGTWRLSSDEIVPGVAPGTTFHADWFGAWDNPVMGMWMDNCINKLLNCSAGNLGNGKIMRDAGGNARGGGVLNWATVPRLVPVSSIP